VHAAFRDHLAREVGQLFKMPYILQQRRAARAGGLDVLIVDDRRAGRGGEVLHVVPSAELRVNGKTPA